MASEDLLQAEARERRRVAAVAGLAALLTLAAPILGLVVLGTQPESLVGQALQRQQHPVGLTLSTLCSALGLLAITYVVDFLARATRGRVPAFPAQARWILWAGGAGLAVLVLALHVISTVRLDHFVNEGTQTYDEAKEIADFGGLAYVGILAQLAFAGGFVMIAVSAMRAGLLTRFLGYLGVISGVLFVLPLVPIPIVQAYWLGTLALLFAGRSPTGTPPAWQSGEAIPWPSAAEMREQRVREAEARRGGGEAAADEPAGGEPDSGRSPLEDLTVPDDASELTGPHPATSRRKRKKRRS